MSKDKKQMTLSDKDHLYGRIFLGAAIVLILAIPVIMCLTLKVFPEWGLLGKGLVGCIMFIVGGFIEVMTYSPMLGTKGTYLAFFTGNLVNLKLPCAVNAREQADVKHGSQEGEIVSTISVATSTIVTTVIIAVGVLVFGDTVAKLMEPGSALAPAFNNVTTALFGALFASYLGKYWRITILPLLVGCGVLLLSPNFGVGTLLFVTIVASIAGVFILSKLNLLEPKKK